MLPNSETPEILESVEMAFDVRNAIDSSKTGFIQVEITIKDDQENVIIEENPSPNNSDVARYLIISIL